MLLQASSVASFGTHTHTDSNITVHTDPPGRVLGHTQTDSNITVHTDPPGRVLGHRQTDRQTDRQYHYMGEELGNYVHQNRES